MCGYEAALLSFFFLYPKAVDDERGQSGIVRILNDKFDGYLLQSFFEHFLLRITDKRIKGKHSCSLKGTESIGTDNSSLPHCLC